MSSTRRRFVGSAALGLAACAAPPPATQEEETGAVMNLLDFEPKSSLRAAVTEITKAKFPVIDAHAHLMFSPGLRKAADPDAKSRPIDPDRLAEIIRWMDELNIQTFVNLTGGYGQDLDLAIETLVKPHPGKFVVCTEPAWDRIREPDYPKWQADEFAKAKQAGAVGVKVLKTLGLYLRENITEGALVKFDDPRFDPMWAAAGELKLPIFVHTADPDAFFTPTDKYNERWEELGNHPNWSFYGKDFPPKDELLAARNRVIAKHRNTQFVGLHVGNRSENLDEVERWMDEYPNFQVEIGARLGELGRQPRRSREFFDRRSDRILFGTDAVPLPQGASTPQQTLEPAMFQTYFRFLETLDEYFDYSPAKTPPQGRWRIYGIGLPDDILRKVYHDNCARLLGLPLL